MKFVIKASSILAVVCCVLYAGSANAREATRGVPVFVTVQDGDWGVGSTWLGGTPPGAGDGADIDHNVTVTGSESSIDCFVGASSAGSLTILPGGSLTVGGGGTLVGFNGNAGTLVIEGTGSLTTADLDIGNGTSLGTLTIRPTANGSGGLTTIGVFTFLDVDFSNSILELDTSLYTPSLSDSWTAAIYSSLSGGFGQKNAPAGFEISTNVARGGANPLIVTVTAVPAGAGLPAATYWRLGALVVVLSLTGAVFMRRRRGTN